MLVLPFVAQEGDYPVNRGCADEEAHAAPGDKHPVGA
jgi:hypothetical protein